MCTVDKCSSNLWQFKCEQCPGKYDYHPYRLWYQRVRGENPMSRCHFCNKMVPAVPRGQEEGIFICFCKCKCEHEFTSKIRMQHTSPCYECNKEDVVPCHFEPRRRIVRKSNAKHSCSECRGRDDCPNMKGNVAYH